MVKGLLQAAAHGICALIGTGLQAQIIARVVVHHRQRMALRIIAEPNPTFEVHLPQQIGGRHLEALACCRAPDRRLDAAGPAQNLMDRRNGRRMVAFALQAVSYLASSPRRMSIAYRQNTFLELATGLAWARMRPARSVCDILIGPPPCKPLVTGVRMNIEPPTELPPVRSLLHRKPYKLASLSCRSSQHTPSSS